MAKSRDAVFGAGMRVHCTHARITARGGSMSRPNSTYLTYLRPALGFPSLSPSLILNR